MIDTAPPTQLLNLSSELMALVAQTAPSVVAVLSHRSRSTGFVWRPGLIVTADEALAEEGDFVVQPAGGDEVSAQLLGRDPSTDIALLRVDHADLQPIPTAAAPAAAGTLAVAIGVHGGSPTSALGVVSRVAGTWRSAVARSMPGSNLICGCVGARRAASRSMLAVERSA